MEIVPQEKLFMADQMNPYHGLANIVHVVAATIALIIFIAIPAIYFFMAYHYGGGQNLHPLQIQTAFAGLLSAALALAIYLALKIWPLRALTRIVKRLDESQESLREKILAKELALLKA